MVMEWCTMVRCIISIAAVAFGVGSGPERVRGWMMGKGSIRGEAIKDSQVEVVMIPTPQVEVESSLSALPSTPPSQSKATTTHPTCNHHLFSHDYGQH